MTAPAAFRATYSDFKLIKTRGVVSISFEVPVEQAQTVLNVLGGMPVAAAEVWCAVARLQPDKEVVPPVSEPAGWLAASAKRTETPPRQEPSTPDGAKTRTAFRDMRPANQAGILCNELPFQKFVAEKLKMPDGLAVFDAENAADYVRRCCNVASRKDIRPRTPSGDRWTKLVDEYRTWMHAPELVG